MIPAATGFEGDTHVHIDAHGHLVIDVRDTGVPRASTTDIVCPKCRGGLLVDDLDTNVLAAQLRCGACGYTFLQRLRDHRRPSRQANAHRFTPGR